MLGDWYGKYTTSVDACGSGGKTGVNYFYDSENKTVSAQAVYELPEFVVTE